MFNVTRDQAEITRDRAEAAHWSVKHHTDQCRKCVTEEGKPTVPCELGSMLQRGATKIMKEAEHALTAYLPAGSTVTYHGRTRAYQGRTWIVAGPDPRKKWSGYTLIGADMTRITASLPSLRLTNQEAQRRERSDLALDAVTACLAVLSAYGETLDAVVCTKDNGRVFVAWTSSTAARIHARSVRERETEAGQYIGAAMQLLLSARVHVTRQQWDEVKRDATNARKLADRVKAQAKTSAKRRG